MSDRSRRRGPSPAFASTRVLLVHALRPILLRLPRGAPLVYRLCASRLPDAAWAAPSKRYRLLHDASLDASVIVDLADRRGRSHYFLGYFSDVAQTLLLQSWLRPGDTFVDIGAHWGMHALRASRLVGPHGRVLCFEPHARSCTVLRAHLALNGIENCEVFEVALSDAPGKATLSAPEDTLGTSTLRAVTTPAPSHEVEVDRGDRRIDPDRLRGRVLFKIDTEGLEHRVILGLGDLLDRDGTLLSVEITPRWLAETGSSAEALFADLAARGFRCFLPRLRRGPLAFSLDLVPWQGVPAGSQYDAVFAREGEI